jgi:phage recombination protein Bet
MGTPTKMPRPKPNEEWGVGPTDGRVHLPPAVRHDTLTTMPEEELRSEYGITRAKLNAVKNTVAMGATDHELLLFLATAHRLKLDPMTNQIYCLPIGGKRITAIGIDGFRSLAEQSGEYDGQGPITFTEDPKTHLPTSATMEVYRRGFSHPISSTVWWAEYNRGTPSWVKMPHVMLGKACEAVALRKAFPRTLSGVYAPEEFGQDGAPRAASVVAEFQEVPAGASPPPEALPPAKVPTVADVHRPVVPEGTTVQVTATTDGKSSQTTLRALDADPVQDDPI